jgi:predicted O-methyltransferase YrrM
MSNFADRLRTAAGRGGRLAARAAQLGLLLLSRYAEAVSVKLGRWETSLQISLEGLWRPLGVKAITDIATPWIDLASENPIAAIMAAPEFDAATAFFRDNTSATRSLVSPQSQALLYCLLRNLKPGHVFEIGSYRAGTTEALCRALAANGSGTVHTVDPFCADHVAIVMKQWPGALLRHVELHAMDSMTFYMAMQRERTRPGLIFVDGNHDYQYALFDIGCGAHMLTPGGFIVIDNIAQAGPFFAGRDFLAANPGWRELGTATRDYDHTQAFDRNRTTVVNTDFLVLQAPLDYRVGERPRAFATVRWWRSSVNGVRLKVRPPREPGLLHIQAVLRGFGTAPAEAPASATTTLQPDMTPGMAADTAEVVIAIPFAAPAHVDGEFVYFTVEPWLIWQGSEPLQLLEPPEPF